jgi:hypothetical protein
VISLPDLESSTNAAPCCYCWRFKMRSPWGCWVMSCPHGPATHGRCWTSWPPTADARCLSLASPAPGSTAYATGVKRHCSTSDVVKIALEKCSTLCHDGRMTPEAFGLQAAVMGGDLPAEWQALMQSQASLLATLLTQIQTTGGDSAPASGPSSALAGPCGRGRTDADRPGPGARQA